MRFYGFRIRDIPVRMLLAAIAIGALAPIVLIGTLGLYDTARQERERAEQAVMQLARSLADSVDRQLQSYRNLAETLAGGRQLLNNDLVVFEDLARDTAAKAQVTIVL